jgi:hypothetical protein
MRIEKTPDEMKGPEATDALKTSKNSGLIPKDQPVTSDLPIQSGNQIGINTIEQNAKLLKQQNLPKVLEGCCDAAMGQKGGLYFTTQNLSGPLETTDVIRNILGGSAE